MSEKTSLVVQSYFMGRWRDEEEFSDSDLDKAVEYMKEPSLTSRKNRIVRRTEVVVTEYDRIS